ncbi:hypothetical protein NPIL_562771 [Nephila pilipes]|uniref:Uncharacterized protein n=1 Tax=Nephila pilipes TaxID=299642 RepID=A0A8X6QVF9_NEPPI|nr:hypothetical protein NPIL_562771 [Nephila pilipes]
MMCVEKRKIFHSSPREKIGLQLQIRFVTLCGGILNTLLSISSSLSLTFTTPTLGKWGRYLPPAIKISHNSLLQMGQLGNVMLLRGSTLYSQGEEVRSPVFYLPSHLTVPLVWRSRSLVRDFHAELGRTVPSTTFSAEPGQSSGIEFVCKCFRGLLNGAYKWRFLKLLESLRAFL